MLCYVSAHFDFPVSIESYKFVSCEVQSFVFVVRVIETWLTVDFCKSASKNSYEYTHSYNMLLEFIEKQKLHIFLIHKKFSAACHQA